MNSPQTQLVFTETYRSPVVFALSLQIPIAILCLLMLDGGQLARVCAVAMAANWCGVLLVMFRRPHNPTFTDLAFIRWGFLGIFTAVVLSQDFPW